MVVCVVRRVGVWVWWCVLWGGGVGWGVVVRVVGWGESKLILREQLWVSLLQRKECIPPGASDEITLSELFCRVHHNMRKLAHSCMSRNRASTGAPDNRPQVRIAVYKFWNLQVHGICHCYGHLHHELMLYILI